MDDNLEDLRRKLVAAPDNEELRAALIIALRRAGFDSQAQKLIKERFHCPAEWDDHSITGQEARHCETCDKPVFFVTTAHELKERAKRHECIVAPMNLVDSYCRDMNKRPVPDFSEGPHCMNARIENRANLTRLIHYPEDLNALNQPRSFILMLRKKQENVSTQERAVVLLGSKPTRPEFLAKLKDDLGVKSVELQFASAKEIARLYDERSELFPRGELDIFRGGIGTGYGV
ncbi:MAG: hypothetical protein P1V97_34480 [Planctomycetota bacterium]|nr:hypothetical protein [Planctomycetota bacterium]